MTHTQLIEALEHNGGPLALQAAEAIRTIRAECAAEARRIKAKGNIHHSQWCDGWNEACNDIAGRIDGTDTLTYLTSQHGKGE